MLPCSSKNVTKQTIGNIRILPHTRRAFYQANEYESATAPPVLIQNKFKKEKEGKKSKNKFQTANTRWPHTKKNTAFTEMAAYLGSKAIFTGFALLDSISFLRLSFSSFPKGERGISAISYGRLET